MNFIITKTREFDWAFVKEFFALVAAPSDRFPRLPPPPSQDWRDAERSQTKGIACKNEETNRRLYDMIDTAVKNATSLS